MIRQTLKDFDIRQIAESGQCFRLRPVPESETASEPNANDTYSLTAWGEYLEISQEGTEVSFSCTEEEFESCWKSYFDLETDYGSFKQAIDPEAGHRPGGLLSAGGGPHRRRDPDPAPGALGDDRDLYHFPAE